MTHREPPGGPPADLLAGRVSRPHGVRGEVAVDVRTDRPDVRFAPGALLPTDRPGLGPLEVVAVRSDRGRLLVRFAGYADRSAVEPLAGVGLLAAPLPSDDAELFYAHDLVGLRVEGTAGEPLGVVTGLVPAPAHDLLEVELGGGARVLVPFVAAIVPTVDLDAGRVVLDPPDGLLDQPSGEG